MCDCVSQVAILGLVCRFLYGRYAALGGLGAFEVVCGRAAIDNSHSPFLDVFNFSIQNKANWVFV